VDSMAALKSLMSFLMAPMLERIFFSFLMKVLTELILIKLVFFLATGFSLGEFVNHQVLDGLVDSFELEYLEEVFGFSDEGDHDLFELFHGTFV